MRQMAVHPAPSSAIGRGSDPRDDATDISRAVYNSESLSTTITPPLASSRVPPEQTIVTQPASVLGGRDRKLYPWQTTGEGAAGYQEDTG